MGWLFRLLLVTAATFWVLRRFAAAGDSSAGREQAPFTLQAHVFKISFRDGRTADVDGRIPRNVLHAFEDIAARGELTGEVRLLGGRELRFTPGIPEVTQQQLRNAYFAAMAVH